jgi:hypothetical protein
LFILLNETINSTINIIPNIKKYVIDEIFIINIDVSENKLFNDDVDDDK